MEFAKFLEENELKIDAWDGKTRTHFSTFRIPLRKLLRQGEASREEVSELTLYDLDNQTNLGIISILMTNEGRRVNKN